MCFVIIPKDSKEEVQEVLVEVTDMLGEFSGMYQIMYLMDCSY